MYDAIIVGGRVAGAPTAMLLARKGYRVLVVDKATFPADALGNNLMKFHAVAALRRWGLLEQVIASGCPPIRTVTYDFGDGPMAAVPPPHDGVTEAYGPRRFVLDQILVAAARRAGVEVWEGFTVENLVWDGVRVAGIRGHTKTGTVVVERARMVIGADGRHSLVARVVSAPAYREQPPLACYYASYWSGVPVDGLEVMFPDRRVLLALGTNDGRTCIVAGWPQAEFQAVRTDVEGHFQRTLDLMPAFAGRVRSGRREERFTGAGDLANFFRRPYGPGWALVGDAGYHRDPLPAQGSSDAFRDAELLVEALDDGWSGHRLLTEALADYERRRNEASMPMYEMTCERARLESPSPEMVRLRRALRCNQDDLNRFAGVTWGTVPAQEFFATDNLARIMTGAGVPV